MTRYKRLIHLIFIIGLLIYLGFVTFNAFQRYQYQKENEKEAAERAYYKSLVVEDDLKGAKPVLFGDRNQFIALPEFKTVLKDSIIGHRSVYKKEDGTSGSKWKRHPKKGYENKLVVLNINDNFKRQEFDLFKLAKSYGAGYTPVASAGVNYKGKDYGLLSFEKQVKDNGKSTYKSINVLLDLKTGKMIEAPRTLDYYLQPYFVRRVDDNPFTKTSLDKQMDTVGLVMSTVRLGR